MHQLLFQNTPAQQFKVKSSPRCQTSVPASLCSCHFATASYLSSPRASITLPGHPSVAPKSMRTMYKQHRERGLPILESTEYGWHANAAADKRFTPAGRLLRIQGTLLQYYAAWLYFCNTFGTTARGICQTLKALERADMLMPLPTRDVPLQGACLDSRALSCCRGSCDDI